MSLRSLRFIMKNMSSCYDGRLASQVDATAELKLAEEYGVRGKDVQDNFGKCLSATRCKLAESLLTCSHKIHVPIMMW